MTHSLEMFLITMMVMGGIALIAAVIGTVILIAHKREMKRHLADIKSTELKQMRAEHHQIQMREMDAQRAAERAAGSVAGKVLERVPSLVVEQPEWTPERAARVDQDYADRTAVRLRLGNAESWNSE
jgi:hypothetical protein